MSPPCLTSGDHPPSLVLSLYTQPTTDWDGPLSLPLLHIYESGLGNTRYGTREHHQRQAANPGTTTSAVWPWADYLTAPSPIHFICKRKYLHKLYKSKGPCDPVLFSTQKEFTKNSICTAAAAKSLQSCPTLCDPRDGSPPGPAVPGILQARTLEWVAISSSNAWKRKLKVKLLSCVRLLATPWTAAYQAPPSMGFSRQEYWSGLPLPSLK